MRLLILKSVLAVVGVGVVWVVAGRQLTMLADRIGTVRVATPPTSPLLYHDDGFDIGDTMLRAGLSTGEPVSFSLATEAANRVVLTSGTRTFVLGTSAPGADTGRFAPRTLVPDAGDTVVLTVERSAISWPTPLELNFMTGNSPSWKRNLYHRLVWTKASGARLDMRWRHEQWYYGGGSGWSGSMLNDKTTGLIGVKITP